MNLDSQTIEQIVAEVVRRISQLAGQPSAAPPAKHVLPANPVPPAKPVAPVPVVHSDGLVLDARVITTATIHGRLKGIRRVVVDRRAVVTPSVKDDLQKRNIRLEYQEAAETGAGSGDLTIVRYTRGGEAARAMATLPLPAGAEERLHDELSPAVACAAKAAGSAQQVAVLVTDESLAAICLLNRSSHVRAASAKTVEEVRRAIAAIGANVLVIDPRDMTANQWAVAIQMFRNDLPRGCSVLQ